MFSQAQHLRSQLVQVGVRKREAQVQDGGRREQRLEEGRVSRVAIESLPVIAPGENDATATVKVAMQLENGRPSISPVDVLPPPGPFA